MTSNNTDEQGVGLEKLNVQKVKIEEKREQGSLGTIMVERFSRNDSSEGWGGRERLREGGERQRS